MPRVYDKAASHEVGRFSQIETPKPFTHFARGEIGLDGVLTGDTRKLMAVRTGAIGVIDSGAVQVDLSLEAAFTGGRLQRAGKR